MSRKLAEARRREGGFTLIELLVVIIILGVLSAVVVFAVKGTGDKGSAAAYATDAKTFRTAQEAYCAKFGRYGQETDLVKEKFLSETSRYHNVELNSGGPCKGAGAAALNSSSFRLTCNADAVGCGTAGAIPTGGTLVINNGATPPAASLNPAINSAGGIHSNSEDMFNGLLRYELNGTIGGDLAQTFNINNAVPSGSNPNCGGAPGNTGGATPVACDAATTVATFVLRENVTFHGKDASSLGDGAILTPADVEFSFSKAILAAHGRSRAMNTPLGVTGINGTTSVPTMAITTVAPSAGNGGTVIFNFRQVFAPLQYSLNVTEAPILSEAAYGPCFPGTLFSIVPPNACAANTSPVGTGPFRFESLDGNGIRTVRNPDYFRFSGTTRLPYFDKLYKKVVTGSAAESIESGEVDVAGISNADRPRLAANASLVLASTPRGSGGGNCITTISFNTTKRAAGSGTAAPAPPGFTVNATSDGSTTVTAVAPATFAPEDVGGTVTAPAPFPATPATTVISVPAGGATAVLSQIIATGGARLFTIKKVGAATTRGGYPADSPYFGQNKANDQTNASPHQILGDSRVREAIFKSLDRNKFWTDIAFSAGRVADAPVHSIFQPNGAYQGPQPLPTFDRTAAEALLNAAGWSDIQGGFRFADATHPNVGNPDAELAVTPGITPLKLEYLFADGNQAFGAEVKSELATVGIDVTTVQGDNSLVVAPRIFNARTYDMGQISYCNNDEPQFGVRRQYHTDQVVQGNSFTNASGYKSVMMDNLWLAASKAPDVATYQARFLEIQRLALGLPTGAVTPGTLESNQKIPMVQLLESAGTRATLAKCTGFNNNNTGLFMEEASCKR